MQKGRGKGALWAQGMQGAKIGDEWSPMARQRRSVALPAQVCPELLSHRARFNKLQEMSPDPSCTIDLLSLF